MKKVALITGGSRGIGLGIAKQLAADGFNLAINGVREVSAVKKDVLMELKDRGVDCIYCRGSIASSEDRIKIIGDVRKHFGKLHLLVNNAGMAPRERRDVLETTEASFDEVLATNLKGSFFLTQLAASWMIEQRKTDRTYSGCIINISSISATVVSVNRGEYCISKAGLGMVTQLFAVRLAEFGIQVFEVRPGIISTDMTVGVKAKYDQLIDNGLTLQKRWGTPEDVGKAVSTLVSGNFPYSSGQVIMVDGGLTVSRL